MKKGAKKATRAKLASRAPTKAALRSDAFARAERNAKSYAQDPRSRRILVEKAARKAASAPQDVFSENWPYLQTMLRLVRAHTRDEYRDVSEEAFLSILTALAYLVDPFDLIPDEIPFLGYVDDATVVDFAVVKARRTLDDFMIWETTAQ
jgi:uncharacterized membrane protein YkvA (DUF1232 family)